MFAEKEDWKLPIKKAKIDWDHDFHIHTNWSLDNLTGPDPEDYLEIAEKNKVQICFLDHYELIYKEDPPIPKDKTWVPQWPFYNDKWNKYLEKMDEIKSNYSFVFSGLEVDYYTFMEDKIKEFLDDYANEFDLLVGTLHDAEPCSPVTLEEDLKRLIKKYGSFEKVVEIYFEIEKSLVKSKLFNAVAHIDTIFRYCNKIVPKKDQYDSYFKTKEIIALCIKEGIWIEYNISGYRYPIGRPFPPESMLEEYIPKGAKFFIGSDSHSVETFNLFIPKIKESNKKIRNFINLKKENSLIKDDTKG
ncbi:MAG: histidinol-phosphatase HisJ family protein [Promethearchaeota archaeon]